MADLPALPDSSQWRMVKIDEPRMSRERFNGKILTLIHQPGYYQRPMDEDQEAMVLASWWDELGDYPAVALDQAFSKWLRTKTTAPTVAELLQMAAACIYQPPRPLNLAPPPVVVSSEELVARRAMSLRLHKAFPKLWRMPITEGEEC